VTAPGRLPSAIWTLPGPPPAPTQARIALAAGSYQLPEPYRGPALELYGCDPRQARLGDVAAPSRAYAWRGSGSRR
jgi:hypothetical protein